MPIIEAEFMDLTSQLDPVAFWEENRLCREFSEEKPRCALSFSPDDHWIFEFEDVPSTLRYYQDKPYRDDIHRTVNAVTREYVGRAFFGEDTFQHQPKRIENLFDCVFHYREGSTPWLLPATDDPRVFADILDRAEGTNVEEWAFPENFLREWETRARQGRSVPKLGTGSRGPATIMTSVIDPGVLFLWMYDDPGLIRRFRDVLAHKMVELNRAFRRFSGNTERGWWITDDNCALFSPALYAEYCAPVLRRVMDEMAPLDAEPPAVRFQHSDSAMAHLLDQQYELGIRVVNYGPEVDPGEIRSHMPDAYIQGQMPPMLLRDGSPEAIREKVRYDFAAAGKGGGLEIATAGSLAAGTGVGRMRWLMQVTDQECRLRA